MEGFSGSSIPSSCALPCPSESGLFSKPRTGQAIDYKLAALKHKYARLQDLKNQQRKGEKSELSLDLLLSSTLEKRNTAVAALLKQRSSMLQALRNQKLRDGKKSELPSVSSKVMTENIPTNDQINLIFSSRKQREPVFYNFLAMMEKKDRKPQISEAKLSKTKNQHEVEEVSTELRLGYGPNCINQKRKSPENFASNVSLSSQDCEISKRKKVNGHEVVKEESHRGASLDGFEDTRVIRKRVEASYSNEQWVRLFLETELVKKHVLTECEQKYIEDFITKYGIQVIVWDFDTKSEHQLIFKKRTNGSNVFIEDWTKEFVIRRDLKEGDEIGLFWDKSNSRFNFSILKRNFCREFSHN
nr:putative b3 domain-containing protein [Quercus suber]